MKAVRNTPPSGVEVVDVDEPAGDGELIKVAAVSICASDFLYLRYGSTQVAGHEIAGTLEDGTPVAVEAIMGCAGCEHCSALALKEVALRPSLGYCAHAGRREFAEVADMLAARPDLPALLITHRYPIEDAVTAFATAADRAQGAFRVVVEP